MERDDVVSKLQEQLQAMSDQLTRADHAGSFLDTDLVCSAYTGCLCGWLAVCLFSFSCTFTFVPSLVFT